MDEGGYFGLFLPRLPLNPPLGHAAEAGSAPFFFRKEAQLSRIRRSLLKMDFNLVRFAPLCGYTICSFDLESFFGEMERK